MSNDQVLVRVFMWLGLLVSIPYLASCRTTSEAHVQRLIREEQERGERILKLPPAEQRAELHRILDHAKDGSDGIHDACIQLAEVGDQSSIPHLIRALRFFGDAELPLPDRVGIICTQQHCVDALESLTGATVGISYQSWKHWWEAAHPGETIDAA